jgi:hypothetical protein
MMMMMMVMIATEGAAAAAITFYTRIPEVFGSNHGGDTGYPN